MRTAVVRSAKEGLGFGIIAGLVLAIAEMCAAGIAGYPPLAPYRFAASLVYGARGLDATPLNTAIAVGAIVHLVLSALFGLIYGAINSRASVSTRVRTDRQAAEGLLFGAALWLVNFQLIARAGFPWFLGTSQLIQLAMHAVFYGLPLGLMYAAAERRVHPVRSALAAR